MYGFVSTLLTSTISQSIIHLTSYQESKYAIANKLLICATGEHQKWKFELSRYFRPTRLQVEG